MPLRCLKNKLFFKRAEIVGSPFTVPPVRKKCTNPTTVILFVRQFQKVKNLLELDEISNCQILLESLE